MSVPSLAEQQAIAALSDADALIESLDQLLAKSARSSKARCRNCSPAKSACRGFRGSGGIVFWGDVISHCSSGATPYRGRPDFYKGTIRWITSGELKYNVIVDTVEHISGRSRTGDQPTNSPSRHILDGDYRLEGRHERSLRYCRKSCDNQSVLHGCLSRQGAEYVVPISLLRAAG